MADAITAALLKEADAFGVKPTTPALRANNPGALMPGGKLAQYKTPEEGLSALDNNLKGYGAKGINTLAGVISRWAPPNDNDTNSYIQDAARRTGFGPNDPIDLNNPTVRHVISAAIVLHENGPKAIAGQRPAATQQPAANDPVTASLLAEASGKPAAAPAVATATVEQIPGMSPAPQQPQQEPSAFDTYVKRPVSAAIDAVAPTVKNMAGFAGEVYKGMVGAHVAPAEAALSLGTGLVAPLVANVAGAVKTLTGGKAGTQAGISEGEKRAAEITNSLTYQPRTEGGRNALATAGKVMEASKLQGMGPPEFMALSDVSAYAGRSMNATRTLNDAGLTSRGELPTTPGGKAAPGQLASVGVSGTAPIEQARAMVTLASPELREAVDRASKRGTINMEALKRHVEADSLPVKVRLSEGQATGDVSLLSHEQNTRGKFDASAKRFNEQNAQLIENTQAIREAAAPDVFVRSKPEQGQLLIDAYKAKDAALNADITAKYASLEQVNGGQFPLDGKAFVRSAEQALHKKLLADHVPAEYRSLMGRLKSGEPMTFENFEALRTNLARTMRSATDGNARAAAGVIRDALESLPMPAGAEGLKPLADAARAAAKSRFELLARDPAYKAVVDGRAGADAFIDKYILGKGAQLKNVRTMKDNLAHDATAQQVMASGTMDYLTRAAGIIDGKGNFSQAGYNKALDAIRPKLGVVFDPQNARQVEALGNVARYTQEQPRGSFVNNSNTLTAALADKAATVAEQATNVMLGSKLHGVPVGTIARDSVGKVKAKAAINKSFSPGAGILLKDVKGAGR